MKYHTKYDTPIGKIKNKRILVFIFSLSVCVVVMHYVFTNRTELEHRTFFSVFLNFVHLGEKKVNRALGGYLNTCGLSRSRGMTLGMHAWQSITSVYHVKPTQGKTTPHPPTHRTILSDPSSLCSVCVCVCVCVCVSHQEPITVEPSGSHWKNVT